MVAQNGPARLEIGLWEVLVGVGKPQKTATNPQTLPALLARRYRTNSQAFAGLGQWKMQDVNLPIHRLFVLGAGFSAPADLPLGNGLLERVRQEVRSSFRHARWDGTLEQEIKEWASLYPGASIDLERVLAYSHRKHHLRLLGSDEYFEHGSRSIVAARHAIQRILTRATPNDTPSLYRDFAGRLCPRDVVLTFNYDTLLEQALDDIGKPYTLTPEWWLDTDPGEWEPKFVDLLKLHGSIDWYDRYYLDSAMRWHAEQGHDVPNRDPIFGPAPTVPSEPLSRGRTEVFGRHILPRVFRVPDHARHFPIEETVGSHIVPFILPPAYDKLLGYDPILDLWENLHRTKDFFSSIVMIGYSMPSYDSYAYETLGRLFVEYQQGGDTTGWEHRRVPIQLVTLANSSQQALECFPFLESAKTRVWSHGLSSDSLDWIDWGDGADYPAENA